MSPLSVDIASFVWDDPVVQRAIRIGLENHESVQATVRLFRDACASISTAAFNAGSPLTALELHRAVYVSLKTMGLSAQMTCTVIRHVASAYSAAKGNKHPTTKPFAFRHTSALWLIGKRGRDAGLRSGVLSIWTVAGRLKLAARVPDALRADFDAACADGELDALQVTERHGRLYATLVVTLPDVPVRGTVPVGVDLNETNALVAVDADDRDLFISGKETKVRNTRTRKTRRRLQKKLATLKAQKRGTRSVVRVLKRLGCRQSRRTLNLARVCARRLCDWAPKDGVLVIEDLTLPPPSWVRRPGWSERAKAVRRRLSQFPYRMYRTAIESRAARVGMTVVAVDPRYTSQTCARCGARGIRTRHRFSCACGHTDHADRNAAKNIRNLYCASRRSGPPSTGPEASPREASPTP